MFGVDHDSKSELRHLMTYLNASSLGKTTVAATQHGYHYRIDLPCSRETAMALRRHLGDDSSRIAFEELEIHRGIKDWYDTLFIGKLGRDGKWHYEEPVENVLALPFLSRIKPIKRELHPRGCAQGARKKRRAKRMKSAKK